MCSSPISGRYKFFLRGSGLTTLNFFDNGFILTSSGFFFVFLFLLFFHLLQPFKDCGFFEIEIFNPFRRAKTDKEDSDIAREYVLRPKRNNQVLNRSGVR